MILQSLSFSLSLIFLSGSSLVTLNGWRNSLLTHAYCWQIVRLRSRPCRVICASRCYVESLNHIGKGHHGNRQTSPRGAFEENYIFQGKPMSLRKGEATRRRVRRLLVATLAGEWAAGSISKGLAKAVVQVIVIILRIRGKKKREESRKQLGNIKQPSPSKQFS